MKRVIWLLAVLLLLTACGGGSTPTTDTANPATDAPVGTMPGTEAPADEGTKDVLQTDEWWTVEGQWKLTVHSAKAVEERNEFADQKPAQVVVIQYSYENLGHKGDGSDLFFSPSTVVDGQKKVAQMYPISTTVYPQPIPIGTSLDNAEDAWGLDNESDKIWVSFEMYDDSEVKQKATFEVPVTK